MQLYGTLICEEPGEVPSINPADNKARYAFVFNKYTLITSNRGRSEVKLWFEDKFWKGSPRAAIRFTIKEYRKELDGTEKEDRADLEDDE